MIMLTALAVWALGTIATAILFVALSEYEFRIGERDSRRLMVASLAWPATWSVIAYLYLTKKAS